MKVLSSIINKKYTPLAFVIIVVLIMYSPVLRGTLWLKWDMYEAIFPASVTISEALKHTTLPLWEPFQNRGVPIANLMGIPIWFPTTILFGLIGYTQELLQIQYVLFVLLGAVFMYLSLNNYVKNKWICALGAIAYATNGEFISNAQHITFIIATALLPFIHFSFKKWIITREYVWLVLLGGGFGLLILNNYPPFVVIAGILILIELFYYLFQYKKDYERKINNKDLLKSTIIVFITMTAVSFASIYTNLKVFSEITRSRVPWEIATGSSLNIWNWGGSISPILVQVTDGLNEILDLSMSNTYIAIPILVLALAKVPRSSNEWILIVLCIFGALLSMGQNSLLYQLVYSIPGMDTFKFPAGLRYVYFYYLTIIAIKNLDFFINGQGGIKNLNKVLKTLLLAFSIVFLIVFTLLIFGLNDKFYLMDIVKELFWSFLVVGTFYMILISFNKKSYYIYSFLILVIIFSALGVWRNDHYTLGTPERPYAYEDEIKYLYNLPKTNLIPNSYMEGQPLTMAESVFKQQFQTGGYVGSFELKNFNEASQKGLLPVKGDPVIWFVPILESEFIEEKLDTNIISKKSVANLLNYSPNKISVDLNLNEPGYVILEQTYFLGWEIKIDGQAAEIVHTDSGVIAAKADSKNKLIEFEYKPIGTIFSIVITFIVWIVLIIYLAIVLLKRKVKLKK